MQDPPAIAIIGAGIAGLTCAHELAAAGMAPVVFEKGRGLGGRVATRRTTEGAQFYHGAQLITTRDDDFRRVMAAMADAGEAVSWFSRDDEPHWVGYPHMSRIGHALGAQRNIVTGCRVRSVTPTDDGWTLALDHENVRFDQVVMTAPAPQAMELLGQDHPLASVLARVRYAPCHTLMVTSEDRAAARPGPWRPEQGPFNLIAREDSKPGRPPLACWVAHTTPEWSESYLETDTHQVREQLAAAFCEASGVPPDRITYTDVHRWRYARVTQALGQACLQDDTGTLWIAGDGCLGPRVEAAWQSGRAVARAIRASI